MLRFGLLVTAANCVAAGAPGLRAINAEETSLAARRLQPWPEVTEKVVACGAPNGVTSCGSGTCDGVNRICVCDSEHFTLEANAPCAVEKRSKTTAILLHLFVPAGSASWYLGWTITGVLTLVFCICQCCCSCGTQVIAQQKKNKGEEPGAPVMIGGLLTCCFACGLLILWIIVIAWIAGDSFDGDGVPLS